MTTVASLTIEMAANVARLQADMGRAANTVQSTTAKMQKAAETATRALGSIGAGLSVAALTTGFIRVADALNNVNARLSLVTNSTAQLNSVQRQLLQLSQENRSDFSATASLYTALARSTKELGATQEQLLRITGAFGKAIVISGGSTQSASAAITQFNQAMASGVLRGEEFNSVSEQAPRIIDILASSLGKTRGELREMAKEGKLTSDVVLPAILKGAKEVEAEFARLPVTVEQAGQVLKNSIGQAVLSIDGATGATSSLAGAVVDLSTVLDSLFASIGNTNKETQKAGILQEGLAVVFETVAVVAANVGFVLKGIGNELGAIGAQVGAVLRGDFAQAAEIGRLAKLDAEAARAQIDATTRNILNARQRAQDIKDVAGITDAQSRRMAVLNDAIKAGTKATKEDEKAIKAANKERAEQAKLLAELAGLSPTYIEDLTQLEAIRKNNVITEAQYIALVEQLIAKQPSSIKLVKDFADAEKIRVDALKDAYAEELKRADAAETTVNGLAEQNKALREEIELIGLTERQQAAIIQSRNEATIAVKESTLAELQRASTITGTQSRIEIAIEGEIEQLKERNRLQGVKINRSEAAKTYENLRGEGKQFTNDLNRGLTDSLFRAFESGRGFFKTLWDGIRNLFKTTVLRLAINGVVGGITGGAGGLAQAATGGLSSLGSIGSGIGALSGAFGSGLSAGFGATLQGGVGLLGTALEGGLASIASTTGAGIASGLGQIAGALGPYGLAAAGVVAVFNYFKGKRGGPKEESRFGTIYSSIAANSNGENPAVQALVEGLQAQYNGLASAFGGTGSVSFGAGISTDPRGTAPSFLDISGTQNGGILFNQVNTRIGRSEQELAAAIAADSATALIRALRASNLDKPFADFFDSVADDATDAVRQAALKTAQEVQGYTQSFELLGGVFATLKNQTVDARNEFIQLGGGLESLTGKTNSYFQNYYSEAERSAIQTQQLTNQFSALGLQLPTSRAGLRGLVDAQDISTAAGRKNAAALIGLSDSFGQITGQVDSLFDSIRQNIRDLYGEVDSTRAFSAAQGRAFIDAALANGGPVDATQLGEATSAVRAGFNDFSTQADADFARLSLAGELSQIVARQTRSNEQMAAQMQAMQSQLASLVDAQTTGNDLARRSTNVLEAVVTGQASLSTEAAA